MATDESIAAGRLRANSRTAGTASASVCASEMPNRRQNGAASSASSAAAGTINARPMRTACTSIWRRLVPSRSLVNTPTKGPVVCVRPLMRTSERLLAIDTTLNAERPFCPASETMMRFSATVRSVLHRLLSAAGLPAAITRAASGRVFVSGQRRNALPRRSRIAQPASAVITLDTVQPSATPESPISRARTQNSSSPTLAAAKKRKSPIETRCFPSSLSRK